MTTIISFFFFQKDFKISNEKIRIQKREEKWQSILRRNSIHVVNKHWTLKEIRSNYYFFFRKILKSISDEKIRIQIGKGRRSDSLSPILRRNSIHEFVKRCKREQAEEIRMTITKSLIVATIKLRLGRG